MIAGVPIKSFKTLLQSAARRLSLLEENGTVKAEISGDLTDLITSAMRHAWQFYPWPDAMDTDEEEVVAHPTVDGAMYVPRQTPLRTLATVFNVWSDDPRKERSQARSVAHSKRPDGVYLHESITTVWIDYRGEPPEYTDEPWSAGPTYDDGALVLHTDGHVYWSRTDDNQGFPPPEFPSRWRQVPVLACLYEPVKQGVISHFKRFQGGQPATAKSFEELMLDLLEHEIQVLQSQQEMHRRYA